MCVCVCAEKSAMLRRQYVPTTIHVVIILIRQIDRPARLAQPIRPRGDLEHHNDRVD